MTVREWAFDHLYGYIECTHADNEAATKEVNEILLFLINTLRLDLNQDWDALDRGTVQEYVNRIYDGTRRWMREVYYHRSNKRRKHQALWVFEGSPPLIG